MTLSQASIDIPIEDELKRLSLEQAEPIENGESEVVDENNEELSVQDIEKVEISPTPAVVIHANTEIVDTIDDVSLIDDINKPIAENDTTTAQLSSDDEGSDFDDFDDFEQAGAIANINGNTHQSNDEDEDDFGDFDEFNQAQTGQLQGQTGNDNDIKFDEYVFTDNELFHNYLSRTMDQIFPDINQQYENISKELLNERSSQIYTEISRLPRLKPPNWIKSKIRHNLLIKLGIPINLDDLNDGTVEIENSNNITIKRARRKSNLQPEDINWHDFKVPEFKDLSINPEQKQCIINETNDRLSKIETDILNNTSKKFLEDTHTDDIVNNKLAQFQANYNELIQLSSVWNSHLQDLQKNFEIYESVVQSTIGYSQKLRRDEILEDLKKLSKSKQKKKLRM